MSDPLLPSAPAAPERNEEAAGWVMSRYADVLGALREPSLLQVAPGSRPGTVSAEEGAGKEARRMRNRVDVAAAITQPKLIEWRARIEPLARTIVAGLPMDRKIDLLRDFVQPWCLAIALLVLDADDALSRRLTDLHPRLFSDETAHAEVKRIFLEGPKDASRESTHGSTPGGEALFLGIADTLPRFLANAVLALLRHPAEVARLRADPELMPRAIEELLRYAGLVHTLGREASEDVVVAGLPLAKGERVILKPASANRDPELFPHPDCLDIARRVPGHVSLGAGPHSCVGASLVRMATGVAIGALLDKLATADLAGEVEWRTGSMLFSPVSLPVILRSGADALYS